MKKSKEQTGVSRVVGIRLVLTDEEFLHFRMGQLKSRMSISDYVKEKLYKAGAFKADFE